MFADDTKIYSEIPNHNSAVSLQNDLHTMLQWSDKWLLAFHPEKCKVLRLGKEKDGYTYKLGNDVLDTTTCEKDLGVEVDDDLSFTTHISKQVNKANSIMGMIRRKFPHLDCHTFPQLFKSIVRPHLEYATSVWNPYLKSDIIKLEQVQRRATKQVPQLKNLSYRERLTRLHLPTLAYRRMRGDVIEVYKMLNGKYDPVVSDILSLHRDIVQESKTRGHSLKLNKSRFHHKASSNSFARRVVEHWNKLPEEVVSAPSLITFENKLDKQWANLIIKYDFDNAMQKDNPFTATRGRSTDFREVP